jgi:5'-nucleotidase
MINQLKSEKCNLIIGLTHMMRYNDVSLAKKFPDIDLILGGHDHLVLHEKINNSILVKSGTNFKNFSMIEIYHINDKDKI